MFMWKVEDCILEGLRWSFGRLEMVFWKVGDGPLEGVKMVIKLFEGDYVDLTLPNQTI